MPCAAWSVRATPEGSTPSTARFVLKPTGLQAASLVWKRFGYERLERTGGGDRACHDQGPAVRLQDVRPVRFEQHGHVVPHESARRICATVPRGGVRADCGNCEVRPEMKCVWHEAVAGSQQRFAGGVEALRAVQLPVDRRLVTGKSSWLREVSRLRARRAGMNFEDEPVPGYPLPILPRHTSPGPARACAARRPVRRHQRAARASGLRGPRRGLPAGADV